MLASYDESNGFIGLRQRSEYMRGCSFSRDYLLGPPQICGHMMRRDGVTGYCLGEWALAFSNEGHRRCYHVEWICVNEVHGHIYWRCELDIFGCD
jgi:hypothetical protein